MKNLLRKFLLIFMTFSMILSINIVSHAENEVEENMVDSYDYDYHKNLFSMSSEDITLREDVYGDVFICTSGTATIDTFISGNVFICASNIEISENSQIEASLFTMSENLTILGVVDGNVYSICQDFILEEMAYINLDLFLTSQNVNINGQIYRDANLSAGKIAFSENAHIGEDLNYSSEQEIAIPDGVVSGNVKYSNTTYTETRQNEVSQWIYSALSFIILVIALFIISKWIHCKFMKEHTNFIHDLPKYLLYGILGFIVTPIISILFLILGITAPLSVILFFLYFILMLIASAITLITISNLCNEKLKEKLAINDTLRTILVLILLCIAYKLLKLIPTVGFIVTLAFVIIGYGILMKSIIPTKQEN